MSQSTIPSPCISVCLLDDDDVCVGCYRTAEEITDWFMADDDGRIEILMRCKERRDVSGAIRLK